MTDRRMTDAELVLREFFGHQSFRPNQHEILSHLLSGRDVLAVMPTGAGKSLCYQIPALLLEGLTLVISPLISLMKDQVTALAQNGVPAAYLNSSLEQWESEDVLRRGLAGEYRLLYVAPERLGNASFLRFCAQVPIAMVTVDEAHCVSLWGHDFRPSYQAIAEFVKQLPRRPVVGAFTATATAQVQADICRLLALQHPKVVVTSFNRSNLYFGVERPEDRDAALLKLVQDRQGESGIIYCMTRKSVESICTLLRSHGVPATRYHAGLTPEERRGNQEDFVFDRAPVMVATNAFGMGIDKSNVSYILHYNLCFSLESYYQEAGRAGRDGSAAECILLFSHKDVGLARFLLRKRQTPEGTELSPAQEELLLRSRLRQLEQMEHYCTGGGCLRQVLLGHFGEELDKPCGNCSGCLADYEDVDVTVPAQKLLSCVVRLERAGYRAGKTLVFQILQGNSTDEIRRVNLHQLSTFGLLSDFSTEHLDLLTERLIERGMLVESGDAMPILERTPRSAPLLFGRQKLTMKRKKPPKSPPKARTWQPDPVLLQQLTQLRTRLSQRYGVPGYSILEDSTLREICKLLPTSKSALRRVNGMSSLKCERYGEDVTALVKAYIKQRNQRS